MDNQQERFEKELDLAWLAGIIDGGGCLGIYRKREGGKLFHYPILDIVNTNPRLIDKAATIVKRYTGCHVELKKLVDGNLPKWSLRVLGFKRVKTFLPNVVPFLVGKRDEAKLLIEFCDSVQDTEVRERLKSQLSFLKNPQRLYAESLCHVPVNDKVQSAMKVAA